MRARDLHGLLDASAERDPEAVAVEEAAGGRLAYGALAALSDRVRDRLRGLGVAPGDRVGMCLGKSIDSLATLFGILKAGASYVPVDPAAPADRNAYIFGNCAVRAVVVECGLEEGLRPRLAPETGFLLLPEVGGGQGLERALAAAAARDPVDPTETVRRAPDDTAYILYTSGSTGKPKGVELSHLNGGSFVDWCSEAFAPRADDRFSSHAPFHFDLSILDIYVPLKHGARVVLFGEQLGKNPAQMASVIADRKLTVWYSTPSILSLLLQYGRLERHDLSALRMIHFAGEVFPVKHLRRLRQLLPGPRFFNLYGPTETNVCTYYEIPATIDEDRVEPFPIGRPCTNSRTKVVDEHGVAVTPGTEGELCVAGQGVMRGYWNLPEKTAEAILEGGDDSERWYKTGDLVEEDPNGDYHYRGRRDRMVKRRGYRIELGEIEAALYRLPDVAEAAVVALPSEESGVSIRAFLCFAGGGAPSLVRLKQACSEVLPLYMIPDAFSFATALPKTSTDKVDYQRLAAID